MNPTSLVTFDHLSVGYGRQVILSEINLQLNRGRFVGLLGSNGAGKSTLIRTILGIIPPLSGGMTFHPINGKPVGLGYVPQRDSLDSLFLLTSLDVVLMGTMGRVSPGRGISSTEKEWAAQCLTKTGAEALSKKLFSQLSGGQKQRVLIARALATKPDLLILDEPTSGIDATARQAVMEMLRSIHQEQKLTIFMANHDLSIIRNFVERVVWLHQRRVSEGSVAEILTPEKIEEILN